MGANASQITSLTIVYSTVYSGADQRKHQSPASLDFVRRIHRRPVNSPHKWPVTRKMFPFDDVIMNSMSVSAIVTQSTARRVSLVWFPSEKYSPITLFNGHPKLITEGDLAKWPMMVHCPVLNNLDQHTPVLNSYRCAFEDSRPIITKFGTRHDSRTVVTCTKFRYDRPTIIEIRGTRIFSKFWIRSNLSIRYLVGQASNKEAVQNGVGPCWSPFHGNDGWHLLQQLNCNANRQLPYVKKTTFTQCNDIGPILREAN